MAEVLVALCRSVGKRIKSALLWVVTTAIVCGLVLGILYGQSSLAFLLIEVFFFGYYYPCPPINMQPCVIRITRYFTYKVVLLFFYCQRHEAEIELKKLHIPSPFLELRFFDILVKCVLKRGCICEVLLFYLPRAAINFILWLLESVILGQVKAVSQPEIHTNGGTIHTRDFVVKNRKFSLFYELDMPLFSFALFLQGIFLVEKCLAIR